MSGKKTDCATWVTMSTIVTLTLLMSGSASAQTNSASTSATESESRPENSTTCEADDHICAVDGFIAGEDYWLTPGYFYTPRAHHLVQVEIEEEYVEPLPVNVWLPLTLGLSAGLAVGFSLGLLL